MELGTAAAKRHYLTYKYRLKDRVGARRLREHAWAVNQIWNYCAAHHRDLLDRYRAGAPKRQWPSRIDLVKLTKGTSLELGVHAQTIQNVCEQFVQSRNQHRSAVGFRASSGGKRALGWVPFQRQSRRIEGNSVTYRGKTFRWFGSKRRPLPEGVKGGAFVEDARGRWWVTFLVEVDAKEPGQQRSAVGIDLGLTALASLSSGDKINSSRPLRAWAERLATAQRAGNKRRVLAIHDRVANIRRDYLHKASTALVRSHDFIAIGDVSASKLARTKMAKSIADAGWASFKNMLRYKCQQAGAVFIEVNERGTSQMCSHCGVTPPGSPKGMGALGIRSWTCDACDVAHDRDTNAALNILKIGLSAQPHVDASWRTA